MRYFHAVLSGLLALAYGTFTLSVTPRRLLTPDTIVSANPAGITGDVVVADLRTSFHIFPPSVSSFPLLHHWQGKLY